MWPSLSVGEVPEVLATLVEPGAGRREHAFPCLRLERGGGLSWLEGDLGVGARHWERGPVGDGREVGVRCLGGVLLVGLMALGACGLQHVPVHGGH